MNGKISGGVYLVVDMHLEHREILEKLRLALEGGLAAVQLWTGAGYNAGSCAGTMDVIALCHDFGTPVFAHHDWNTLNTTNVDGVHFDEIPENFATIKTRVKKAFCFGITCGNDEERLQWAVDHGADYISFCTMFPSASAGNCEIVMPASVSRARALTDIPVFVSGGMTPENIAALRTQTTFDGVAVVSGIMQARDPRQQVLAYKNALKRT